MTLISDLRRMRDEIYPVISSDHYQLISRAIRELDRFNVPDLPDEALADIIHDLSDELDARLAKDVYPEENWLKRQLRHAQLHVRSWSTNHQRNMRGL